VTYTIHREVTISEARPGDRVTITGVFGPARTAGIYEDLGHLCITDNATEDVVHLDRSGVDYKIEREVQATDQEPPGLGAVVRTVGTERRTFVRVSLAMSRSRWNWMVADGTYAGKSWSDVLGHSDLGAVEVLAEGWVEG